MRVYIIEDVELMLEVVHSYVSSLEGMEIVGEAEDGMVAMNEIAALKPDLVLTDINLPEVNGLEILYLLKRKYPQMRVVLFTGSITRERVKLAYEGGADGFIEKSADLTEFRNAIEALSSGQRYFGGPAKHHLGAILADSGSFEA
ncbi:response regulator transcription factor [Rubellicoccus peritrichatus]|uniref:Response regulator transcription factor n=1 Tax=Rubellicoccus peritrichatus TaxID=3080537 RepID=A0AAQ3LGQ5_9BACT|nr:response regulator transcription factor [Puniceicoccus sp. CR14]WOO41839.1 response regulator transcription factor [Puniceicoccus sp. CR14]